MPLIQLAKTQLNSLPNSLLSSKRYSSLIQRRAVRLLRLPEKVHSQKLYHRA